MGWFPASYVKLLEGGGSAPAAAAANGGDKTAASAEGTAGGTGMNFRAIFCKVYILREINIR